MPYEILKHFEYQHLPPNLQSISRLFYDLAHRLAQANPESAEMIFALRKLLESKDCAVRSMVL